MASITSKQNIRMIFARNISIFMNEMKKSRTDVCRDLGIKYTTFCDWINGRTIPREDQLVRLSRYFDVEVGELFIETDPRNCTSGLDRFNRYLSGIRRLDMKILENLSDEQIRDLIRSGFTFTHRTLDEYIKEAGELNASEEIDWGRPTGREIW